MRAAKLLLISLSLLLLCGCQPTQQVLPTIENETSSKCASLDESATSIEQESTDKTDEYGVMIGAETSLSRFPLYAMIKEENIYLYGVNGINGRGMVLFIDGQGTYFDWPCPTPRRIMPQLSYFDYDGDGEKELAVILYTGSGTGIAKMNLYMLKINRNESDYITYNITYEEYSLESNRSGTGSNLTDWFNKQITAQYAEDNKSVVITFDGTDYIVEMDRNASDLGSLNSVEYGDIVEFKFTEENEIVVSIKIGLNVERAAGPYYVCAIEANVVFDGSGLSLSDLRLVS